VADRVGGLATLGEQGRDPVEIGGLGGTQD